MPMISTLGVIKFPLSVGLNTLKRFDQGWREIIGGQIIYSFMVNYSKSVQVLQNNSLKTYLLTLVLWIVVLFSLSVLVS
jgi:hypothetical protein